MLDDLMPYILEHAIREIPRESVGFICPDGTLFFLTNEAKDEGMFQVSSGQLEAWLYGEGGVLEAGFDPYDLTFWHTHPSGFIGPSREDLRERRQEPWVNMAHLVIALPSGTPTYY